MKATNASRSRTTPKNSSSETWSAAPRRLFLWRVEAAGWAERKFRLPDLSRLQGHIKDLFSVSLMPGYQPVIARWKAANRECAIPVGHGKEGVIQHPDICLLPRMLIAFDRDHNLTPIELLEYWSARGRLRDVPLTVDAWSGMRVMRRQIAVDNHQGLARSNARHTRHKL